MTVSFKSHTLRKYDKGVSVWTQHCAVCVAVSHSLSGLNARSVNLNHFRALWQLHLLFEIISILSLFSKISWFSKAKRITNWHESKILVVSECHLLFSQTFFFPFTKMSFQFSQYFFFSFCKLNTECTIILVSKKIKCVVGLVKNLSKLNTKVQTFTEKCIKKLI